MNIISIRQQARLKKIVEITESLRKSEDPDIDKLIMFCCSEWGITKRTAKELIEVAQFNIREKG